MMRYTHIFIFTFFQAGKFCSIKDGANCFDERVSARDYSINEEGIWNRKLNRLVHMLKLQLN
jgi:hypothetical protein